MQAYDHGDWRRPMRIRLPREEEIALYDRMREGDREARDRLVESQLPWVITLARKHVKPRHDQDDLIAVGVLALLQSLKSFDARKGRLSTWVRQPVEWRILAHLRAQSSIVHRPANRPINQAFVAAWETAQQHTCLPAEIGVYEPSQMDDADLLVRDRLYRAIERLPERLRLVVRLRLKGMTLLQIGRDYGLTKERIRQMHNRAIELLRAAMETDHV